MNNRTYIAYFIVLLLFFLNGLSVLAQNGDISGTVTDETGETIVGASVYIDGTTKGTTSDIDGKYTLAKIDAGTYSVVYSFIGLKTQKITIEVKAGQTTNRDVVLKEDALMLEDVVVIGYGRRQKRDVTGAIETIKAKDIQEVVVPSFEHALQGRAAGVQITSANGTAGAPVNIRIRGPNSISAGNQPLYVIDGIPITDGDYSPGNLGSGTNAMADLTTNDIESIEILKDAAAASIYGSRGANGVILITTKKGISGKTRFNASYTTGLVTPASSSDFLSASEQLDLRDRAFIEKTGNPEPKENAVYNQGTRYELSRAEADSVAALGGSGWVDKTLRTGNYHEAYLSASGGGEKVVFYIAGSYRKEKGFLVGNEFERINGRLNVENHASDKMNLGANISLSQTNNDRVPIGDAGGMGRAQQIPDYVPVYNNDGSFYDPYANPLWQIETKSFEASVFRTISNVFADYRIIKGLVYRTELGCDILNQLEEEFNFRNEQDSASQSDAWDRRTSVYNWTTNNYFNYTYDKKEGHLAEATIGHAFQKSRTKGVGLHGWDFPNDYLTNPSSVDPSNMSGYGYQTGYWFNSYFFRLNYRLKEKYLAGLSIRNDGSSRFGENKPYGWFPAISAGWVISDEHFLDSLKAVSFLKLRASYGVTGNANISDYAYLGYYGVGGGYAESPAITPAFLGNDYLGWEKSIMLDVNVDYGLYNNRISGNMAYYNKKSSQLLLEVTLPLSSGYSRQWMNVGAMKNQGVEFTVTTRNLVKKLKWTTDFNIAFNQNEVTDLAGLGPDAFDNRSGGDARVITGYEAGIAYLVPYAGVQKEDGFLNRYNTDGTIVTDANGNPVQYAVEAGTPLYYDVNDNLMTFDHPTGNDFYGDNRRPVGNPFPKFIGGITNEFIYGSFDFRFMWSFVYGNTIYDDQAKQQVGMWKTYAQRKEIEEAWSEENPDSDVPGLNQNDVAVNSDRFLYDGSYIRLKTMQFGYNSSKELCKKLHLGKLRIYITATNLLTFTNYPGWDPEVVRNTKGSDMNVSFAAPSFATPQTRTISAGIQIEF